MDGAQVSVVERDRPRCLHDLEHVVGPDLEDGAQGFMAPYDLVERALQRFDVEGPVDAGTVRKVEQRGIRIEVGQEQEASLCG